MRVKYASYKGGVVSSITHVISSLQQICSQHPKIQGRCVVNTGVKPTFNYGYHLPPYIVACSKPVPSLGVPTMVGANCCRRARAWSQVHSSKICERWWMFDDDDDDDDADDEDDDDDYYYILLLLLSLLLLLLLSMIIYDYCCYYNCCNI